MNKAYIEPKCNGEEIVMLPVMEQTIPSGGSGEVINPNPPGGGGTGEGGIEEGDVRPWIGNTGKIDW